MPNQRILIVDDEELVLRGIERQQGENFDISTALGPHEALAMIERDEPYAVVVSDMRMPEINGVELLAKVRQRCPNSVRMVLTGFAELETTISAINQGHIFRFLSKPCKEDDFADALKDALNQYALVEAEKELLEGTLRESVHVLCEMLSLVNPLAFGQANRVRSTVDGLLKRIEVEDQWQLEIAAMLSSLGCVSVAEEILKKKLSGRILDEEEEKAFEKHPRLAGDLIHSIPRLEEVAEIIRYQHRCSASLMPKDRELAKKIKLLRIAIDFDVYESRAPSSLHALSSIKSKPERYDIEILEALVDYVKSERVEAVREVVPAELSEGMVLGEDLRNDAGVLLMSKGQKISAAAKRLIENFSEINHTIGPIKVVELSPQPC
ncbi:MAG: HD domain-containing phosphohydrolase [Planctomycetota bacterium]